MFWHGPPSCRGITTWPATLKITASQQQKHTQPPQILEVALSLGLKLLVDDNLKTDGFHEEYVDAHHVTPYGVSSHLLIPVLPHDDEAARVPIFPPQVVSEFEHDEQANSITFHQATGFKERVHLQFALPPNTLLVWGTKTHPLPSPKFGRSPEHHRVDGRY